MQPPTDAPEATPQAMARSPVQEVHRKWLKTPKKKQSEFDHDDATTLFFPFLTWVCGRRCLDVRNTVTKCTCMMIENVTLDERVECAYTLEDFAIKSKEEQQTLILQWMRYAEVMQREVGRGTQGRLYLLPGSNNKLICRNALARIIGFKRTAWNAVKKAYSKKIARPKHGLCGKAGNKKNKDYDDLLFEFFTKVEAMAEPRATRIVRDIVSDRVDIGLRDDDDIQCLPAYLTKRGLYNKLLADCQWEYCYDSNRNVTSMNKLSPDAEEKVPSWTTFRRFWKKHYPKLVIQKPTEDICGECYQFANSYKTLSAAAKKKAKDNSTAEEGVDADTSDEEDELEGVPDLDGETVDEDETAGKH